MQRMYRLTPSLFAMMIAMPLREADTGGSGGGAPAVTLEVALASLDPDTDEHWTADGLPRMDALESIMNDKSITREQVDALGFTRDKARQFRAEAGAAGESTASPDGGQAGNETGSSEASGAAGNENPTPASGSENLGTEAAGAGGDPEPDYDYQSGANAPVQMGDMVVAYAPPKDPETGAHDGGFDGEEMASAIVVKVNDDGSVNLKVLAPNGGADIFITGVRHRSEFDEPPAVATWDH